MKDKIEKAKKHLAENKAVYISGGVCFAFGATTILFMSANDFIINESFKFLEINWNSQRTSEPMIVKPRGHRGDIIRVRETNETYGSRNEAAAALGVSVSTLRQYFHGKRENVRGYHLTDLGENLGQPV